MGTHSKTNLPPLIDNVAFSWLKPVLQKEAQRFFLLKIFFRQMYVA